VAAVIGLTLVGAVLRVIGLGEKAHWQDEVATIHGFEHRFVDILTAVADSQS
jgi:hypothetical protein